MNKETMNTLLMTVGIEIAVVMALVGSFLIWKMKRGKTADRNAAQVLVKSIKKNEKGRRESLLQVFGESYDMEEEELNAAVDEFLKRERTFFKTLISVYVERDAGEFSKLTTALEEMVKPYSDLALSTELSVDNEQLEALQEQNQVLGKELDESKKVMDELLSEYTATFDKEGDGINPEAIQEKPDAPEASMEDEEKSDSDTTEKEQATDSEEMEDAEGTMELTVDTFEVAEEPEQTIEELETTDESNELVVEEEKADQVESNELDIASDLIVEEQVANDEIEAELEIDEPADVVEENNKNEVALDEFDEELEAEVF